jgi:hypothetical protein
MESLQKSARGPYTPIATMATGFADSGRLIMMAGYRGVQNAR